MILMFKWRAYNNGIYSFVFKFGSVEIYRILSDNIRILKECSLNI